MIDWIDTAIHFAVAAVLVGLAGTATSFWAWQMGILVVTFFWVREAIQRFDRAGIDGDPAKALNPFRWGLGSQMELLAPIVGAVLAATAWSLLG